MDTNELQKLAEAKFSHAIYRKNLRERIESQLVVTHNGGLFVASKELISFLTCWEDEIVYLEDSYLNPVKCDRTELLVSLKQAYQFAMNAWHTEFENSKKIRKLSDV